MRHALGFYRALIMTGLYTVDQSDNDFNTSSIGSYIPALKWCIAAHPILSAAIRGENSEIPEFVRPETLDLKNHIQIIDPKSPDYLSTDEIDMLKQVTLETHDQLFPDVERIPPWKVVVLPLSDDPGILKRVYVIFAYSHSHGDGKSGLAFHKTFLEGLKVAHYEYDHSPIYRSPTFPLPLPLEEACKLRITWSCLLFALVKEYLPHWLCKWPNSQASGTLKPSSTWLGKPISYDPENFHTGSEIMVVDNNLLSSVLTSCRSQGTKFTGLLNQLIVHALSEVLPVDTESDSFIGQIVIDLRTLIPDYTDDLMVNCISAIEETYPRFNKSSVRDKGINTKHDKDLWNAVRNTTARLVDSASTLVDQSIGLLQYINNFRAWYLNKLGGNRNSSYEISNLVNFDPSLRDFTNVAKASQQDQMVWDIERMIFSQPANVTNCPLNFQIVTRKGGDMVITLNWQLGVLGVVDEKAFTKDILSKVYASLTVIASDTS